ncbi:MAG: methyl-accepting chemotaxis protein [Anaerobacillus sp.]|uniref:methyl-accepting chemotaxis protein n=1 Tax=Anaerobacillus sp. TaxID=1872506 RepID=UPI003918A2C9
MWGLKTKIIVLFSTLILVLGLGVSYFIYNSAANLVVSSVAKQASSIGEYAIEVIDTEQYKQITIDNKTDYYFELRKQFDEIRKANGLEYIYTMTRVLEGDQYTYYYVADGMSIGADDASELGDIEEEIELYPELVLAFETESKTEGELSKTEEHGALVSSYLPIKSKDGEFLGILGIDYEGKEIYELLNKSRRDSLLITISMLILGIIITFFFSRYLTKPITKLTSQVQKVSQGDLTVDIDVGSNDEVGVLTKSFQHMVNDLNKIIQGINYTANSILSSTKGLNSSAQQTGEQADQITISMVETASGINKQTVEANSILDRMSNAVEQLELGQKQISRTVEDAQISTNSALEGQQVMNEAVNQLSDVIETVVFATDSIHNLSKRSQEIGGIVTVISDISNQTNLLALNAAIEAARAGDSGKGFAVVAQEVRKLAEQSQQAAEKIVILISDIQSETNDTVAAMEKNLASVNGQVELIKRGGNALDQIVDKVSATETNTKQVEAVFEKIRHDIGGVLAAIENISAIIQETSAVTEEVAASSEGQLIAIKEVVKQTSNISRLSSDLHNQVEKFKLKDNRIDL